MSATDLLQQQARAAEDWLEVHREAMEVHDAETLYDLCGILWRGVGRTYTRWAQERPRDDGLARALDTTARIFVDLVERLQALATDLPLDEYDTEIDLVDLIEARDYCERTVLPDVRGEFDLPEDRLPLDRHRQSLEEADQGGTVPLGDIRGG